MDLFTHKDQKLYPNLLESERKALFELMHDEDIVIRNADKGGAIVVQDKSKYVSEIERQLSDRLTYTPLNSDPTFRFANEIKDTLKRYLREEVITDNEYKFMIQDHAIRPVLYGLPKCHRNLQNPPARCIVSGIGSLTEPISQYVDSHIKGIVTTMPSYLKDTTDFLRKLKDCKVDPTDILCSLDVSALYPSIPHEEGLSALRHFLDQRTDKHPPTEMLLSLTNIVLTKNYFRFQDRYYLQCRGTAMGSPTAVSYSNLFMAKFEEDYIYNNNPFSVYIKTYWRYIDDLFIVWTGSADDLKMFHQSLNTKIESIKFTLEYDHEKISFLDVLVKKKEDGIHTEVYKKETARNTFLHYTSYHPPSLKRSLPYSQLLRYKRICDENDVFELQSKELCENFRDRGYDPSMIDSTMNRARQVQREDLFKHKNRDPGNTVALVSTYSPISGAIKSTVNKHWHILESDPVIGKVFQTPPRFFYKRQPSLRQHLVRSDLPVKKPPHFLSHIPSGNFPCHNCVQCHGLIKGDSFLHPKTKRVIKVKGRISCTTKWLVYLLCCSCPKYYVGKTKREFKTRICEHKCSIRRHDEKSPVARHFNSHGHTVGDLRYMGIETVRAPPRGGDRDRILLQRECFWVHFLDSLESAGGMNEELILSCFL